MEHDTTHEPLDADGAGATALRGSALRSGGYIVGVLLSLASAPLVIRQLGIEGFGVFVTISSLVAIVQGASELGLTAVGLREWAERSPEGRSKLLADLLGARLALTLTGICGAFAFAVLAGYDSIRLAGVAVACVGLVLTSLQAALAIPLAATLRQGRIAAADVVRQAVQVLVILAIVVAGDARLVPLLAAAIPAALASLVITVRGVPGGLPHLAFAPRRWFALLKDTIPFAAASSISVLYLRATVILTSLVATESATGAFGTAFRVLEVLINVPSLLVGALFPLLAHAAVNNPARLRMTLGRTWSGAVACGGLVGLGVAAGAPVTILALTGERNSEAIDALRILGAGLGFSFVGAACQYGLLALRGYRDILLINVSALAINVALTLLLAGPHGAAGAATALGVSEVVGAGLSSLLLTRRGQVTLSSSTAWRVGMAVAAGAAVAVALTPIGILAAAVVAPLVGLVSALALRAIPAELLAMVPGRT